MGEPNIVPMKKRSTDEMVVYLTGQLALLKADLERFKNPNCPCGLCNLNRDLIDIKERLHKIEEKGKD